MLQLSWEALQEGKSVLTEVDTIGDRITRADVLLNMVDMQVCWWEEEERVGGGTEGRGKEGRDEETGRDCLIK